MSIGSLGIVIGLAGTAGAQRASEVEQAPRESEAARARQSVQRAEQAAGIGQTQEDAEASDRDADGRRFWEQPADSAKKSSEDTAEDTAAPQRAKDPSGSCGTALDLVG